MRMASIINGPRVTKVFLVTFIFFFSTAVFADVLRYIDDSGKTWYVDRPEAVPQKYRDRIIRRSRVKMIEVGDPEYVDPGTLKEAMVLDAISPSYKKEMYRSIEIIGEEKFIDAVKRALGILRQRASGAFTIVREHVGRIQQGRRTRMWTDEDPPTMTINKKSAYITDTFTSGIIAHEAYHSKLYKGGNNANPNDYESIQAEELKCIQYEKGILIKIGAPGYEIKMAESQDGTHFDVDKDGDFDLEDYKQMNW